MDQSECKVWVNLLYIAIAKIAADSKKVKNWQLVFYLPTHVYSKGHNKLQLIKAVACGYVQRCEPKIIKLY